ncbi:hypothetical protein [Streptomyces sp. NBC_00658]
MEHKKITLHTEPHVVQIGDIELVFLTEVMGNEFANSHKGVVVRECCSSA